jgi:hypothetical protein
MDLFLKNLNLLWQDLIKKLRLLKEQVIFLFMQINTSSTNIYKKIKELMFQKRKVLWKDTLKEYKKEIAILDKDQG